MVGVIIRRRPAGAARQEAVPTVPTVLAVLVVLAATACAGTPSTPQGLTTTSTQKSSAGSPLAVAAVRDIGVVQHPDGPIGDGGKTAVLGDSVLWAFGDTFLPRKAADGWSMRSNTGGWAKAADPFVVRQSLEGGTDMPLPLVEYDATEAQHNTSKQAGDRDALWPVAVVATGTGTGTDTAAIFTLSLQIRPSGWTRRGVAVATISAGEPAATRTPDLVFSATEPEFDEGAVRVRPGDGTGQVTDGDWIYVFACEQTHAPDECRLAKVETGRVTERAAYTFFTGAGWSSQVADAGWVPGSAKNMSIGWNPHLHRWLAVYSKPLADQVMARTAERLEGPWTEPVTLFTGLPATDSNDYVAVWHPELGSPDGTQLRITYNRPLGNFRGEIRTVEVTLR